MPLVLPSLLLTEAAPDSEQGIASEWLPGAVLVLAIAGVLVWLRWYHWRRDGRK